MSTLKLTVNKMWKPSIPQFVRRRWKLLLWVMTGLALPCIWPLWICLRSPDEIVISRQTTYLTSPVTVDGYVDLVPEFNRIRMKGIQPGATINAAAFDKLMTRLKNRYDKLNLPAVGEDQSPAELPGSFLDEIDELVAFLKNNRGVVELPACQPGQEWSFRMVGGQGSDLDLILNHQMFYSRTLPESLSRHIALLLQERRTSELDAVQTAWIEVNEFTICQKTVLSLLLAFQQQANLVGQLKNCLAEPELSRSVNAAIPVVAGDVAIDMSRLERVFSLSALFWFHSGGEMYTTFYEPWIRGRADWNQVLRDHNANCDRVEKEVRLRIASPDWHRRTYQKVTSPPRKSLSDQSVLEMMSEETANWVASRFVGDPESTCFELIDQNLLIQRRRELLNAATFVVEYQQEHSGFPDDLSEAGYSDAVRLPFEGYIAGESVKYSCDGNNCRLTTGEAGFEEVLTLTFDVGKLSADFND